MGWERLCALLYGAEIDSTHPLAEALSIYFRQEEIVPVRPEHTDYIPGRGVKFEAEGKSWFIGSADIAKADGEFVSKAAEWQGNGLGVVAASCDGSPVALFCVEDRIQPDVAEAIRSMTGKGSEADVSVAMGTGSDIAIDVAQLTLVGGRLSMLPEAMALSARTVRIIRENLFWAFIYNIIGIPIAAGVLFPFGIMLTPMIASAAMALSSVGVVGNSLRI